MFVLDNATLWIGDGRISSGYVIINGETIAAVGEGRYAGDLPCEDLGSAVLSPGLIDLMLSGAGGFSILRDDPIKLASYYAALGVTSCQFCSGNLSWELMAQQAETVRRGKNLPNDAGARILGLYMEGPFKQPELSGGSLQQYALPAKPEYVQRVLDEFGDVLTAISISPGIEGDVAAIRRCRERGVIVSMSHADAPAPRVVECLGAGTNTLGHVWNNNHWNVASRMPTIDHVALVDSRVEFIHLICDGVHVHPILIDMVLRCRGLEPLCLVSDALPGAGMPDGPFVWDDGREFFKRDGALWAAEGQLAGSVMLLPDLFRNFLNFTGIEPHEAIQTVTYNPARSLHLHDRLGRIAAGLEADLVMWDRELQIRRVWIAGREWNAVSSHNEVAIRGLSA